MATALNPNAANDFFYEHASWSYDPKMETPEEGRRRCAERLAQAEAWLTTVPHQIEWGHEQHPDRSFLPTGDRRPLFFCMVKFLRRGAWEVMSLGDIDLGPTGTESPEYMRVVVAELALELMPDNDD